MKRLTQADDPNMPDRQTPTPSKMGRRNSLVSAPSVRPSSPTPTPHHLVLVPSLSRIQNPDIRLLPFPLE